MADREISLVVRLKDEASGAFKSIGSTALKAMGGLGVAGAAGGAALAKLAIDAAPLEGIQDAFRGIAETSGTSMKEMLGALKLGSAGMVSQRELMKTYNSAAQLVGPTFANQLPEAMQYLGKVSAATGEDMGFMLDSLVKGVGRLSGPILDNLGIQVALSEATERASDMFGVEASALTKAQQQAGMMSVVLEKLQKNTAAMPDVSESAATKMARFGATIADAKDQIGLAFLPVIAMLAEKGANLATAVLPFLTERVAILSDVLSQLLTGTPGDFPWEDILPPNLADIAYTASDAFETTYRAVVGLGQIIAHGIKWGEFLGLEEFEIFRGVSQPVRDIVEKLAGAFFFLYDHADAVKGAFKALAMVFAKAGLIQVGMKLVTIFTSLTNPLTLLMTAVGLLGAAWAENWFGIRDKTAEVMETLGPIFENVRAWVEQILPEAFAFFKESIWPVISTLSPLGWIIRALSGDFDTFLASGSSTFQGLVNQAQQYLPMIQETITNVFNFVTEAIQGAIAWIQENGPRIVEGLVNAFSTIMSVVGPIISELAAFVSEMFGVIISWVQENWPLIQEAVSDTMGTIQTVIETVLAAIQAFWIEHGTSILNFINNLWAVIKFAIEQAINLVLGVIKAVLLVISGDWESAWTMVKDTLSNIWEGIKTVVTEGGQALWELLGTAVKKLPEIVRGIGDALLNAGKAIVERLWEGLKGKLDEVMEWFKGKLDGLRNMLPFSEPKDPRSPLRNLAAAGRAIVGNMEQGLQAAVPKLEKALLGLNVPASVGASPTGAGMVIQGPMIQGPLVGHAVVREEGDLERLAQLVADELALRARARGAFG